MPENTRDTSSPSKGGQLPLKHPAWRKLKGAAADRDLMKDFAAFRKQEREREDSRP